MEDNIQNEDNGKMILLKEQKYLGKRGLIFFISVMVMFIPFSLDLYLPALPSMTEYFNTSSALVSLTLTAFFVFYAAGIIFFGPLSDKMGRKPVLILGIILYIVASIFCSISLSVYQLILSRIIQAFGAGSITAIATALVKDCFKGKAKDKVLAIVQAMSVIAPMIAPIVGALILKVAQWRQTFWVLIGIGILTLITALFFQETLPREERYTGSVGGSLLRLVAVSKNKSFSSFLILTSFLSIPFMAYISMSSFIYVNFFHLDAQIYSYFFATNAAVTILGPYLYVRSIGKTTPKNFAKSCFGLSLISGLLLLTIGGISPWLFLISFAFFTLVTGAIRPFSTSILLELQNNDIGSASSLINAIHTIAGSVGMILGSLAWGNIVMGLGIILTSASVITILYWIILMRSKITIKGLN